SSVGTNALACCTSALMALIPAFIFRDDNARWTILPADVFRKKAGRYNRLTGPRGASPFLSHRRAKHQAPNPKHQSSSRIETPKTKLQTPKKSQVPSSKPRPAPRACSLELLWSLELGVWCLGPGASLEFGIWSLSPGLSAL